MAHTSLLIKGPSGTPQGRTDPGQPTPSSSSDGVGRKAQEKEAEGGAAAGEGVNRSSCSPACGTCGVSVGGQPMLKAPEPRPTLRPPANLPARPLDVQRKEALRNLSPDELLALRWYARNRLEALKKALDTGSYVDPDPLNGGVRCVRSARCRAAKPGR